jgi:hypothetical protein
VDLQQNRSRGASEALGSNGQKLGWHMGACRMSEWRDSNGDE